MSHDWLAALLDEVEAGIERVRRMEAEASAELRAALASLNEQIEHEQEALLRFLRGEDET